MSGARSRPLPFIVGCGRSGTTLLAAMLDSHPDLAIPGESGFILELCRRRLRDGESVADAFLAAAGRQERYLAWRIDEGALRLQLARTSAATMADAVRVALRCYAAQQGKTLAGEKTPDHVLVVDALAGFFPEAVFIHLVRDGRDVALSTIDAPWGPGNVVEAGYYWRRRVEAGRRAGTRLGTRRYLEMRYEDLVAAPDRELRRVCRFAGVDFVDSMLDHSSAARRHVAMSPAPSADRSLLLPPTPGLRDWRTQMSTDDAAVFAMVAGRSLASFGYEPGPSLHGGELVRGRARIASAWTSRPVARALRKVSAASPRRARTAR